MNRNLSGCYMYVLCSGYISAEGRRELDMKLSYTSNRAQSLNSDWMDVPLPRREDGDTRESMRAPTLYEVPLYRKSATLAIKRTRQRA